MSYIILYTTTMNKSHSALTTQTKLTRAS